MKKRSCQVLVVLMAVWILSLSAIAKVPPYLNETGFPIVNEPLRLEMLVGQASGQGDFKDLLVFQEYEKLSGIEVD